MPITQKQVAENLGLSLIWVTRALNNHPTVPEATRQRIQQAALEMGYHNGSNREARALAARRYGRKIKSDIIAVLTQQARFEGSPTQNVPYFVPFINGVEDAASEREIDIFFCSYHNDRLPRLLQEEAVDGVICLATGSQEVSDLKLPVVTFGGTPSQSYGLRPDDKKGARLATSHLLELGHRRIAFLGFALIPGYSAPADRLQGYKQTLKSAGVAADAQLIDLASYSPSISAGREAMQRLLAKGKSFSGLVCFNDLMAMGAIEVLRQAGQRVPHDVSVVGFDDVSTQYSNKPKLTSISFNREAMGRRAVEWICRQLDNNGEGAKTEIPELEKEVEIEIFPVELVVRNSTSRLA